MNIKIGMTYEDHKDCLPLNALYNGKVSYLNNDLSKFVNSDFQNDNILDYSEVWGE